MKFKDAAFGTEVMKKVHVYTRKMKAKTSFQYYELFNLVTSFVHTTYTRK